MTRLAAALLLALCLAGGPLVSAGQAPGADAQAAPPAATGETSPAAAPTTPRVRVELLSEVASVAPAATFWVGLRQEIAPGWHTYWFNPGDSGEPARIEWELPTGFVAGEIAWPHPERIPVGPAMSYGYSREVLLLVPVTAPAGLVPGTPIPLRGRMSWLVCDKVCIPEEAAVALTLRAVAGPAAPDPRGAALIAKARGAVPTPAPWPASFTASRDTVTFTVAAAGLAPERVAEAWFYPARWGLIEHAAPQRLRVDAAGLTLEVARGPLAEAAAEPMDGVLVLDERLDAGTVRHAFALRASPIRSGSGALSLLRAAGLALVGGLILNLMPCVLPVLSVKALGLVRHGGEASRAVRRHGLVYAAGVLASLAALAGALLALRAGGEQIGWGFQLQSPGFVAALAYVFFAMALVLSGVLAVGARLSGLGGALAAQPGYAGSFFTGALAVVAATPCTAPFMGTALGIALAQPWPVALAIFEALGLGLALPYLALTAVPAWRRFLPRPGPWMVRLQRILALPLYATVAWLLWVLHQQAGREGVAAVAAGLGLIAAGAALYRATRGARAPWRSLATTAVAVLALGAAATAALAGAVSPPRAAEEAGAGWEPFSPARLAGLAGAGKPVFVNVTAAWCITCLVNERVALRSPAVAEAFTRAGVVALKADWTRRDPAITAMLDSFGRSGVPLYVLYPPARAGGAPGSAGRGGWAAPQILPQVLTEAAVLEAVGKLAAPPDKI